MDDWAVALGQGLRGAVLALALAVLSLGAPASAQTEGPPRRPCANPTAPTGCDSTLPTAPPPNTSLPGGADSPLRTAPAPFHVPLGSPPPAP